MNSIRARLTLRLCIAMATLFILAGVGVHLSMAEWLESQFDETLSAKARALITASEVDDDDFEIDLTVRDFAGFGPGGQDYFEMRRIQGNVIARSPSLRNAEGGFDSFEPINPPPPGSSKIVAGTLADGTPARFYLEWVYPKDDEEERFQDVYLIAASPTAPMLRQVRMLAAVLAGSSLIVLVLMIPLVRGGLSRGMRPLHNLSSRIDSIQPNDLHSRLDIGVLPAELKPLATTLNAWLGRLEESFERERRFSAHAAHELRTPLAEIRATAELGAQWPEEATPDHCQEIVAVCDELAALLDQLALLAKADSARHPIAKEHCQLQELVAPVLARFSKRAESRDIHIAIHVADASVVTDPTLWNAIFQNLVANAVAHAPHGSTVEVEVAPGFLVVTNPAPDLSPDDLPHLAERFWSKSRDRGHSGLGLPLVHACAERLGGSCTARLEGGSLRMEVRFPSHDDA